MVANCKQDQYLFLVWESADLAPARGYSKPDSPARAQVDNMDKALWIWVNPWGYSSTGYHCYRTGSLWWIWLKTLFQTLSLDRQFSTVQSWRGTAKKGLGQEEAEYGQVVGEWKWRCEQERRIVKPGSQQSARPYFSLHHFDPGKYIFSVKTI